MNSIAKLVLSAYGIFLLLALILLVFLLVRRIKKKKLEDFEQRDN